MGAGRGGGVPANNPSLPDNYAWGGHATLRTAWWVRCLYARRTVGLIGLTAATTVLVYIISVAGGARGANPATLVLAGVALGAVFGAITSFLTLIDPDTFGSIRNWNLGSVARTSLDDAKFVIPFLLLGFVLAVPVSTDLNSIALGDDLAASPGTKVVRTRVLTILAVTVLAGGATVLTGGFGFVGLLVPAVPRTSPCSTSGALRLSRRFRTLLSLPVRTISRPGWRRSCPVVSVSGCGWRCCWHSRPDHVAR